MAISDKLTYLNTTKLKLKDIINYTNAGIDGDTTFRNYPKKLYDKYIDILANGTDTLYNNIPKASGTGSSITLNGTASTKLKLNIAPSELSQSGTPSPSSPQTIHKITGNNTITIANSDSTQTQTLPLNLGTNEYCKINEYKDDFFISTGKNYIGNLSGFTWETNNIQGTITNYSITVKHLTTSAWKGITKNFNDLQPGATMRISVYGITTTTTGFSMTVRNSSNQVVEELTHQPSGTRCSYSFTVPSDGKIVLRLYAGYGDVRVNDTATFTELQLEYGDQITSYEPSGINQLWLKKNICKIASYNGETITSDYISTTGGLDTGATVYYQATTPDKVVYMLMSDTLKGQIDAIDNVLAYSNETNISQTNADLPFVITANAIKSYDNI